MARFYANATDTKAIDTKITYTKKDLKKQLKKQLIDCSKLCNIELEEEEICTMATDLLLGIEEESYENLTKKRLTDITLLMSNNIWTATLPCLLTLIEQNNELEAAYNGPKDTMSVLMAEVSYDYLSHTPLEVAYRWTLACSSAKTSKLEFGDWTFKVKCKGVEAGRIFVSDKTTLINDDLIGEKVQENILYYVDEGKGKKSHPLFDLFFLCKHKNKDTLVIIDITGGIFTAEDKLDKLPQWIQEQKLEGIVLAPGAQMANKIETNAAIIAQTEALEHLAAYNICINGLQMKRKILF